jgi:hypothetical protein
LFSNQKQLKCLFGFHLKTISHTQNIFKKSANPVPASPAGGHGRAGALFHRLTACQAPGQYEA